MDVHFQYSNNRASIPNIQAFRHLFTVFKYFKYSNNCVFIPSIQVSVHVFPYFLWIYFHWRGYRQNLPWKTGVKGLFSCILEKQSSIGVIRKEWSENMLNIYRLTPMDVLHGCSSANLVHIFRRLFPENTSGGLYLHFICI